MTINYQAYSKWFAYIANQIAYNRNWLDQRLDRLSFNGAGSEFDDTDIIDAIQHIPAYDDSGLISAVDNVSNIIVEQFGKNESQVNLPYIGMNVSERVRGVRLDSFDFIDLTSSSGSYVYVSESPLYYAGISRNKTGVGDISFSSAFASDPDDVVMDVSFTETVFTEVPTKAHPMVYTYSIELPKAQLDAAGVRYGDCIWRSFPLPVMDRTAYIFDARIPINGQTSTTYIASMEFHPSWDASGEWIGWCDDTDTVYESMLEPTRLYHHSEVDMSSGVWYLYSTEPFSFDVVYASRFTAFLQAQFDRVVDASGTGEVNTDLTDVTTRMDTIIDLLQNTSGDAACEHTYEQDMTTEATCTLPGLMVSTCSKCGDSYSEIVDPLGHDWQCTDHVAAETDPETGEETAAAYDIYTCSRCEDTYNDYSGDGAPEDYGKSSISRLIVELFSRLGKLVGSLLGFVVNVFDKALTSVDDLISRFNSYTEQITGFGGAYPAWLGGLWGILPADLQVALTFAVVCMAVALVGKKLVFS